MDATESVLLVNPTEERIYCIKPVDLVVIQSNSNHELKPHTSDKSPNEKTLVNHVSLIRRSVLVGGCDSETFVSKTAVPT